MMLSGDEGDDNSTSNESVVSSSVGDGNAVFGINPSSDGPIILSLKSEFQRHVDNDEAIIEPIENQRDSNACASISLAISTLSQLVGDSLNPSVLGSVTEEVGKNLASIARFEGISAYDDREKAKRNEEGLVPQHDKAFLSMADAATPMSKLLGKYNIHTKYEGVHHPMMNLDQVRAGIEKLTAHLVLPGTSICVHFGYHVISVHNTEDGGIELIETLASASNPIHAGDAFRVRFANIDSLSSCLLLYFSNKMRSIPPFVVDANGAKMPNEDRSFMATILSTNGSGERLQSSNQVQALREFEEELWKSATNTDSFRKRLPTLVNCVGEGIRSIFKNKNHLSMKAVTLLLHEVSTSELDEYILPVSKVIECGLDQQETDRVMGLCCFTPSGFTHRLRFTPESRTAISHAIFVLRGMIIEAEADDDVETAVPMQEESSASPASSQTDGPVAEDDTETDDNTASASQRRSSRVAATKKAEKKTVVEEEEEGSASDDDTATGDGAEWDLTKIYTIKELNKKKPTMCDRADDGDVNCGLVACSRWESKGQAPWNSCLDCQVNDFEGFPDESDELPIDYMTEEHRTVISDKCSHPKKKKKFPNLPTFKPLVARQLSDNPNPSRSLFECIIKGTPLPDKAYRWNENDAVRKVGRTLPSALELIKIGKENGVSFVGVDSKAPAVKSVTRLCILHHPVSPDQAVHGVLRGIGPASAPHNSTMNTLTHQETSILSMTQSVGQDSTFPLIMGTTAVVSICPYGFSAEMKTKNGEEHETYLKIRKESRLFVVEYVKALTQLFHNLVSVAFFGEAYPFYQDNLAMVDASMVDQVRLGLGGIAHPCSSRYGTREEHSIVQLKTSGTYYGKMLQKDYVFDLNDPKTEMFIRSTPRLMMDEEKHSENVKAGLKKYWDNISDEDMEAHKESIKEGQANMSEEAKEKWKKNKEAGLKRYWDNISDEDREKKKESRKTIIKNGESVDVVASMAGAASSVAAAARYGQERGKFYCDACGGLPSTRDGETFGNGMYNKPHHACTKKPQGRLVLTELSKEVMVEILQRAYCPECSKTGILNGSHECSGNGGKERLFTSLTAPPSFVHGPVGQSYQVMVMKFKKKEGGGEVPVDSWRAIGSKSKTSGKICIEDVAETAAKALQTPGATISPNAKFLFKGAKNNKVKVANRLLATNMSRVIVGDGKLEDGELRLGDYVYRGVKIVPSSQD